MIKLLSKTTLLTTTSVVALTPMCACAKEENWDDFSTLTLKAGQNQEFNMWENYEISFEFDIDHKIKNEFISLRLSNTLSKEDKNKDWLTIKSCDLINNQKKVVVMLTTKETQFTEKPDINFTMIFQQYKDESTSNMQFVRNFVAHYISK